LLPPAPGHIRLLALGRLAASFLWQSVVGGVDVAWRAFHPRIPLRTGFLPYRVGIPAGPGRSAFGALTSLMPGTLPVGTDTDDALIYHCLDLDQPVAAGLAREEALFARVREAGAGGTHTA
jgi:multicomponent Na+:H+ antiporter subunit E